MTFLEVLREDCGVTSAKNGCSPEGACGCCAVLFDGRPALSCLRKPENMEGHEVVTLEGMPEEMRKSLGEAFMLEGGVQCGFCIPGILVRASHLVREGKTDDRDAVQQALAGHICRCTGYARILDAIQTAGEACKNGGELPRTEPRRHFYFGEEYGLNAQSADSRNRRRKNGIGDSPSRYRASTRHSARSLSSTTCSFRTCCTRRRY